MCLKEDLIFIPSPLVDQGIISKQILPWQVFSKGCHDTETECMEVIVKIGKTNTMTNALGKTKTKTDKDKKLENKRITAKFSN